MCVFMEMQMRLPHGCVNKNTNLPPYNNDCCVRRETQEEKETLNTHRLDQNWQCHPPTHCVNFGLPWLKLGDRDRNSFLTQGTAQAVLLESRV